MSDRDFTKEEYQTQLTRWEGYLSGLETAKHRILEKAGQRYMVGADGEAAVLREMAASIEMLCENTRYNIKSTQLNIDKFNAN